MFNLPPRVLAIIPARGGSKGVPGKHLQQLYHRPLLQYTLDDAAEAKLLNAVILTTDSMDIWTYSRSNDNLLHFPLRPSEIAQDHTPMIDVITHVVQHCDQTDLHFDYVCILQPTCPFRSPGLIDRTISHLIDQNADSLVTIRPVPDRYNPHWTFTNRDMYISIATGDKEIISRRQDLPHAWYRDGQIYLASMDLVRTGVLLGTKLIGFLNQDSPDINIDTQTDWIQAENIASHGYKS